jgi:hypothetical protein
MKIVRHSFAVLLTAVISFVSCTKESPVQLIANAGPAFSIQLPTDTVTLSGSVTSGQTSDMNYLWSVISGPNNPEIVSNTSANTLISGLVAGTYVFQFQVTNSNGLIAVDTTSVVVVQKNITVKTITIQPGASTGQDAFVSYVPGLYDGNGNFSGYAYLVAGAWTWFGANAGAGWERSFIKFTALDTLPSTAVITSAVLSLSPVSTIPYSGFIPDSYYPGSQYDKYGDNSLWLQKCTQNWDVSTITYNNQPTVDTTHEVGVAPSTSEYSYAVNNLDITQLIKDMKTIPGTNFGFCMRLQTEVYYRSMAFDASRALPDSSTGPKLVVTYQY